MRKLETVILCALCCVLVFLLDAQFAQQNTNLHQLSSNRRDCNLPQYCITRYNDSVEICRPLCPNGFYSLPGMTFCEPFLTCDDLRHIEIEDNICLSKAKQKLIPGYKNSESDCTQRGSIKNANIVSYRGRRFVMTTVKEEHWREVIFGSSLQLHRQFAPLTNTVSQLIGFCNTTTIFTQLYSLGDGGHLMTKIEEIEGSGYSFRLRVRACLSLAESYRFLHELAPPRINQDMRALKRGLSQFLLQDDLTLVLNDLDVLPLVGSNLKCLEARQNFNVRPPEHECRENTWRENRDAKFHVVQKVTATAESDIFRLSVFCRYIMGYDAMTTRTEGVEKRSAEIMEELLQNCEAEGPKKRPKIQEVVDTLSRL